MSITISHINNLSENIEWGGFGYIGARLDASEVRRENADAIVVEVANKEGLTEAEFFLWANSKLGRWFMDTMTDATKTVEDVEFYDLLPTKNAVAELNAQQK